MYLHSLSLLKIICKLKYNLIMIANMLKICRVSVGYTQKDLGLLVGVSNSTISRLENNKRRLTVQEAKRIASALKLVPEAILVFSGLTQEGDKG